MYSEIRIGLVLLLAIFVVGGCQDSVEDTFNADDFMPTAKRDYNFDERTVNEFQLDKTLSLKGFDTIVKLMVWDNAWREIRKKNYLHRFGSNQELTIEMITESDTGFWYITTYSDSLMTQNALFNWLDCFGDECESIRIEEAKKMKVRAGQVWYLDTMIVYYETKGKNLHTAVRDSLSSFFDSSLRMHFQWDKNKKIVWDLREHQSEE